MRYTLYALAAAVTSPLFLLGFLACAGWNWLRIGWEFLEDTP